MQAFSYSHIKMFQQFLLLRDRTFPRLSADKEYRLELPTDGHHGRKTAIISSSKKYVARWTRPQASLAQMHTTHRRDFSLWLTMIPDSDSVAHAEIENLFMLSVCILSYGCTREVWRARRMRKSYAESNSTFLIGLTAKSMNKFFTT